MVTIFLLHLFILWACLWTGFFFYHSLPISLKEKNSITYAVTGLIILTSITQIANLFIPINLIFCAGIFLSLTVLMLVYRKRSKIFINSVFQELNQLPLNARILMAIFWIIIVIISSGPVLMDDTESYHIQMVKWIQEYGSVPGLVNLHERFGFNSSWFSSIALFNLFPSSFTLYTALNGMISVWFCYYLLQQISRDESRMAFRIANIFVLTLLWVLWPLARGNAATSNYDFITTFIIYVLFIETFHPSHTENKSFPIEWILWPVFLFTVRILNYPLLLISLYALLIFRRNAKAIWPVIILCTILVLGFFSRNFIVSGYLFYPVTEIDLLYADWKPDPAITEKLREYIKYYNRVSTTFQDISVTKQLGSFGWIPEWFRTLYWHDKIILIPGFTGLVTGLFFLKGKLAGISSRVMIMILTFVLVILSWFFISPDPRFIYGCLLAGNFLLAYHVALKFDKLFINKAISIFITTTILFAIAYCVHKVINNPSHVKIITPLELPVPESNKISIDNIIFRIPQKINNNWNTRCYEITLPCLYEIHPNLQPRGKDIRSGFRIKK